MRDVDLRLILLQHLRENVIAKVGSDPDLKAAYDLGANAYVVKPAGAFWALINEPAPVGRRQ